MRTRRNVIVSHYVWLAAFAAAAGLTACGPDAPTKPPSTSAVSPLAVIADGGSLRGFVGEPLANPVAVQVVDSSVHAVQGRRWIRFSVAEGGGTVSDTVVLSSESGRATVKWVLGAAIGLQQLSVSIVDAPSPRPQRVFAQAFSFDAADRIVISGTTSGTIGLLVRTDETVLPYTLLWPDTVLRLLPRAAEGSSEEVTAFTVGHPPVSVLRPWTDGVDTVRIAFRSPIAVPFAIWITHDFDTTAARARHDLAALDAFWRSRMTGLWVGPLRVDSAPNLLFECGEGTRGYFDGAAINVYYLKIGSPVACDARIIRMHVNNPLSFADKYDLILAHEVGHALSLDHVGDAGNVMWPDSPPGGGLTTGQIYWMHFHSWGALNSVVGIHPTGERNCNVLVLSRCPAQTFTAW